MQEILNLNSEDYDFEAYIIAIGKDSNNEIRVFNMKRRYNVEQSHWTYFRHSQTNFMAYQYRPMGTLSRIL